MNLRLRWLVAVFALACAKPSHAVDVRTDHVELSCHRTANEDVPENTLESLEQAAFLGCDVVEVDVRRTLDGKLVLQHDGTLERLTDDAGDVEDRYYADLRLLDAGGWMNERFAGLRIPLFEDAIRRAKELNIRLYLDMKDPGMVGDVVAILRREGMLDRVQVGGDPEELKKFNLSASDKKTVWVLWNVTADEIAKHHAQGERVMANFSESEHAMDLQVMRAVVAAGVDGINVDYPRLGADAVGRPVERRLAELAALANSGAAQTRAATIFQLSRYRGFVLQDWFTQWLLDPNGQVSRAAAIALVTLRPRTAPSVFAKALRSEHAEVRANAAWAIGMLPGPSSMLLPLLRDVDPKVRRAALIALAHVPGVVSANALLPLLRSDDLAVRGAAAVALARHQPEVASSAIPAQLARDMKHVLALYDSWLKRGKPPLTEAEKATLVEYYRCQAKEVLAISMLRSPVVTRLLERLAFRPGRDYAVVDGILAAFNLWDRIADDPAPALNALDAKDPAVADRAEWMLIHSDTQGGAKSVAALLSAIEGYHAEERRRAIRIAGWRGQSQFLPTLQAMSQSDPADAELIAWAIAKIQLLHPRRGSVPSANSLPRVSLPFGVPVGYNDDFKR